MASLIKASTAMQRLRWLPGKPTGLPSPINVIVKEDVGASAKRLKIYLAIHVSIAGMGIAIHGDWKNGKFNEEISQLNKEKAQLSKEKAKRDQEVHEETTDRKKLLQSVNEIEFLIRQFGLKEREDKGAEVQTPGLIFSNKLKGSCAGNAQMVSYPIGNLRERTPRVGVSLSSKF